MIDKINSFQNWVETISTASLGVISGYFINEILQMDEKRWLFILVLILVIILFEKALSWFLRKIISNFPNLRKLIAGHHFIEGYWVETVVNVENPDQPYGYSLIRIWFSEMKYIISGEIINKDLTDVVSNFISNYSDYRNYTLTYYFKGINVTDKSQANIIGRGDFEFVPSDKAPIRLRGSVVDTKNHSILKVEAEKVNNELLSKYKAERGREVDILNLVKEHLNT